MDEKSRYNCDISKRSGGNFSKWKNVLSIKAFRGLEQDQNPAMCENSGHFHKIDSDIAKQLVNESCIV